MRKGLNCPHYSVFPVLKKNLGKRSIHIIGSFFPVHAEQKRENDAQTPHVCRLSTQRVLEAIIDWVKDYMHDPRVINFAVLPRNHSGARPRQHYAGEI